MSAFLGKIHFWLYNKIVLHENLIDAIVEKASVKGYDCKALLAQSYERYGAPVVGSLEENINHSNIHGWLQERIHSVEKRLAFIVTELLKKDAITLEEISSVFYESGKASSKEIAKGEYTAKDLYTLIFDHMLAGMPCDHVNTIVEDTENSFSWTASICPQREHWEQVNGDVNHFYSFRDSWIQGFLDGMGTEYRYYRTNDISTIKRG